MTLKIKCPKCKGKGAIALSPPLRETLSFIKAHPGTTAPEIWEARKNHMVTTAVNRRLDHLLALGFVRRKQLDAKTWGWWEV